MEPAFVSPYGAGRGPECLAGYSTSNWMASFMIRSHGMSIGRTGDLAGTDHGPGRRRGVFCGGLLADRSARRDLRWYMWLPALTGFICVPFMVSIYLAPGAHTALLLGVVPGILFNVYLGNTIATTHGLVGLHARAVLGYPVPGSSIPSGWAWAPDHRFVQRLPGALAGSGVAALRYAVRAPRHHVLVGLPLLAGGAVVAGGFMAAPD